MRGWMKEEASPGPWVEGLVKIQQAQHLKDEEYTPHCRQVQQEEPNFAEDVMGSEACNRAEHKVAREVDMVRLEVEKVACMGIQ